MKISIRELRRMIREGFVAMIPQNNPNLSDEDDDLDEAAVIPGKWVANDGEPVTRKNAQRIGNKSGLENNVEDE